MKPMGWACLIPVGQAMVPSYLQTCSFGDMNGWEARGQATMEDSLRETNVPVWWYLYHNPEHLGCKCAMFP